MSNIAAQFTWSDIIEQIEGRWPEWQELSGPIERDDWKARLVGLPRELVIEALRRVRAGYSSKRPELKWVMEAVVKIKRDRAGGGGSDETAEWNRWFNRLDVYTQRIVTLYCRIYSAATSDQTHKFHARFRSFEELIWRNPLELKSDSMVMNSELGGYAGGLVAWIDEDEREPSFEELRDARNKWAPLLREKLKNWDRKMAMAESNVPQECLEPEESHA